MRNLFQQILILSILLASTISANSVDLSVISPDGSIKDIVSEGECPWLLSSYNGNIAAIPGTIANTSTTSVLSLIINNNEPNCVYNIIFRYSYNFGEDDSFYVTANDNNLLGFRGLKNPGQKRITILTQGQNLIKFIFSRDELSNKVGGYIYDVRLEKTYLNSDMWSSVGSEQFPYLIKTPSDLNEIAFKSLLGENFESKYFKLNNDITVNTDIQQSNSNRILWTPIGNNITPFAGTFDGNNFTISGIYCEGNSNERIGFFGETNNACIRNLNILNSSFSSGNTTGGIVGYSLTTKVTNSSFNGIVSGISYRQNTGGIVGCSYNSEFLGCKNYGSVQGGIVWYNGGIAGFSNNSVYSNCVNFGTLTFGRESRNIGGIVGYSSNDMINNSVNEGAINCNFESFYVGGIVGSSSWSTIENSYNSAQILGTYVVGGISGQFQGFLRNCYNSGIVLGYGGRGSLYGGISGGNVENCYYLKNSVTDLSGIIGATNFRGTPFNLEQKFDSVCIENNMFVFNLIDSLNKWVEHNVSPGKYYAWEKIENVNNNYPIHFNKIPNIEFYFKNSVSYNNGGQAHTNFTMALVGASVTLYISPSNGFELSSVMIDNVDLSNQVINNQLIFTQPNSNVNIEVVFKEKSVYTNRSNSFNSDLLLIYQDHLKSINIKTSKNNIGSFLTIYDITGKIQHKEKIYYTDFIIKPKLIKGIYMATISNCWLKSSNRFIVGE